MDVDVELWVDEVLHRAHMHTAGARCSQVARIPALGEFQDGPAQLNLGKRCSDYLGHGNPPSLFLGLLYPPLYSKSPGLGRDFLGVGR